MGSNHCSPRRSRGRVAVSPWMSSLQDFVTPPNAASQAPRKTAQRSCSVSRWPRMTASLAMVFSLVATLLAPLWLLALGPVLLGVPHLMADVRYLILRRGLHHRRELWLPVGIPLAMVALGGGPMAGLMACAGAAVV